MTEPETLKQTFGIAGHNSTEFKRDLTDVLERSNPGRARLKPRAIRHSLDVQWRYCLQAFLSFLVLTYKKSLEPNRRGKWLPG